MPSAISGPANPAGFPSRPSPGIPSRLRQPWLPSRKRLSTRRKKSIAESDSDYVKRFATNSPPRPHCRSRQDTAGQGVIIPASGGRLDRFWRTYPGQFSRAPKHLTVPRRRALMDMRLTAMRMEIAMRKEIDELSRMPVSQLRQKYLEVFGEASRSNHKKFLFRRIAWRIQALAEGGLSERAIANDADLHIRPVTCATRHWRSETEWRSRRRSGRTTQ